MILQEKGINFMLKEVTREEKVLSRILHVSPCYFYANVDLMEILPLLWQCPQKFPFMLTFLKRSFVLTWNYLNTYRRMPWLTLSLICWYLLVLIFSVFHVFVKKRLCYVAANGSAVCLSLIQKRSLSKSLCPTEAIETSCFV